MKAKKRVVDNSKAPSAGERKSFRKRVLLSNDNALEVPGLQELSAEAMSDATLSGQVLALPSGLVDQLRSTEAFKPTQSWKMFRRPSMLVRRESIQVSKAMLDSAQKRETLRLVITGERLAGKSTLLLQAMANAYLNKWVVFNIPEGKLHDGRVVVVQQC
jgi:small subunit ribosomal protein S29